MGTSRRAPWRRSSWLANHSVYTSSRLRFIASGERWTASTAKASRSPASGVVAASGLANDGPYPGFEPEPAAGLPGFGHRLGVDLFWWEDTDLEWVCADPGLLA